MSTAVANALRRAGLGPFLEFLLFLDSAGSADAVVIDRGDPGIDGVRGREIAGQSHGRYNCSRAALYDR
jgi:hypothetical protein